MFASLLPYSKRMNDYIPPYDANTRFILWPKAGALRPFKYVSVVVKEIQKRIEAFLSSTKTPYL